MRTQLDIAWRYLKGITRDRQNIGPDRGQIVDVGPPAMNRNASALWKGNLHEGEGTLTSESGVLSQTRFSQQNGSVGGVTNPDELIAASMSGCFSMALAKELGRSGFHPHRIETTATATLEELSAGWTLAHMQLDVRANVPDVPANVFMDAALAAKTNCPVCRVLKTNISMTATLDL